MEKEEILTLEKHKRTLLRMIFGRTGVIVVLLAIQLFILFSIFRWLNEMAPFIFTVLAVLSFVLVLYIINTDQNATFKIAWIVLILLVPVFGTVLYFFLDLDFGHRRLKDHLKSILENSKDDLKQDEEVLASIEDKGLMNLSYYLYHTSRYPVYKNTDIQYFPQGEDKFEQLIRELEKAKDFIFLEYFIIDEGIMWGRILNTLAQKVQEGVEVRVMYDGTCEFSTLPRSYPKKLRQLGIQAKAFAPIYPFISTHYNYRDHRKIVVIDGHTAFTGGTNLADEYINVVNRYGHWKDTAVMIKGEAVRSFTLMFLQMWNINESMEDFSSYLNASDKIKTNRHPGYVIPFGDSPLDDDLVGEMVYIDILSRATEYVYIMSPYLILDGEMVTSLKFAAQRGVDVRIILPHLADKDYVFALAKTHYRELLRAGVKIYEYLPGFVHAKSFVSDDMRAVVGTINLDYRSLYHHFECALYMEQTEAVLSVKEDSLQTLSHCKEVSMEDVKREKLRVKLIGFVLKLFAPLM